MNTLIAVLSFSIAIILLYKYYLFRREINNTTLIKCRCTDTSMQTSYERNIYIYYYSYIIDNEEYTASDRLRYKNILFTPKINDELDIYVNNDNKNVTVTPLNIFYSKIYLAVGIICIILPFLIL